MQYFLFKLTVYVLFFIVTITKWIDFVNDIFEYFYDLIFPHFCKFSLTLTNIIEFTSNFTRIIVIFGLIEILC